MSKWPHQPLSTFVSLALILSVFLITAKASFSADAYSVPQTAEVTLTWDANDPAPDGYRIYQREDGQSFNYSTPSWTGPGITGVVYNLNRGATYHFVVRAYAGSLESADSEEVSFVAPSLEPPTYSISATAGEYGSITPEGMVAVTQDADQTFTITPDSGCRVADVKVDGQSMGAISAYTFGQVAADHTIEASFALNTYHISAEAGANGSISPQGDLSVDHGSSQTFTFAPDDGCHVANVTVDGVSQGALPAYTFENVVNDHTISVSFGLDTYQINASAGANGSISPSGITSTDFGSSQSYTISPAIGYQVADVLVDGASMGAMTTYTFDQIDADHSIHATFSANTFAIAATAGGSGTITPEGVLDVAYGSSQTYTFKADDGFHISDVLIDGQSIGASQNYTFLEVTKNHAITVTFSESIAANIWIEAEDGDLQWPMEIGDDTAAAAGGYVWVPSGTGDLTSPSSDAGYAEYHFDVPENGDYVIWGRQISNDTASDSFFVSVDGQANMAWHTKRGGQDVWIWDVFSLRNPDDPRVAYSPERFWLTAGAHTLRISQREDGTKLDKILITNRVDLADPEPDSAPCAMAFGDVQIDHTWSRVNFDKPFVNPVVVAGPVSLNGDDPTVVRIRNVDSTGFEIRLQEWQYLDGLHGTETVSYLVMEQGNYTLEDGTKIEAANLDISAADRFQRVGFKEPFTVAPVVMTTVTSFNDADTVTGRVKKVTTNRFKYKLQEQEVNTPDHGAERLSYIAWEPSSGVVGGTSYAVGQSADAVTHETYILMFEKPFTSAPVFLADMQTTNGGQTANIRYGDKGSQSVDVWIDEEQSKDTEVRHNAEVVGYMAFSR